MSFAKNDIVEDAWLDGHDLLFIGHLLGNVKSEMTCRQNVVYSTMSYATRFCVRHDVVCDLMSSTMRCRVRLDVVCDFLLCADISIGNSM